MELKFNSHGKLYSTNRIDLERLKTQPDGCEWSEKHVRKPERKRVLGTNQRCKRILELKIAPEHAWPSHTESLPQVLCERHEKDHPLILAGPLRSVS